MDDAALELLERLRIRNREHGAVFQIFLIHVDEPAVRIDHDGLASFGEPAAASVLAADLDAQTHKNARTAPGTCKGNFRHSASIVRQEVGAVNWRADGCAYSQKGRKDRLRGSVWVAGMLALSVE